MKKIKILQIGLSSNMGGIETYLINMYRNINRDAFEISFMVFSGNEACFYEELKENNVTMYQVEKRTKNYYKYIKDMKKVFMENEFDFIHFNLMDFSCFERILMAKRYSNARIILHSHIASDVTMSLKTKIFSRIGKYFIKNGKDKYLKVACSKIAGEFMFKDFKHNEYTIFHNAIDISKYKYEENIAVAKKKELEIDSKIVIGHIGRFVEQKNHKLLIDIFYELNKLKSNLVLLLVGEGPLKDDISLKIEKLNLKDRVMFMGIRKDIPEILQAMDVFIMPSQFEGLPFVAIEAQATGLPCFISNTVSDEVKLSSSTVFFDIKNTPKQLAKEILERYNQIYLVDRKQISNTAINSKFNIKKEIIKFEEYYIKNK